MLLLVILVLYWQEIAYSMNLEKKHHGQQHLPVPQEPGRQQEGQGRVEAVRVPPLLPDGRTGDTGHPDEARCEGPADEALHRHVAGCAAGGRHMVVEAHVQRQDDSRYRGETQAQQVDNPQSHAGP